MRQQKCDEFVSRNNDNQNVPEMIQDCDDFRLLISVVLFCNNYMQILIIFPLEPGRARICDPGYSELYRVNSACISVEAAQQTRDVRPMLIQSWASVADGGPTLNQHWANVPCLLGGL